MMVLVTGGSGSGKSAFAEDKILSLGEYVRETGKMKKKRIHKKNGEGGQNE